MWIGLAPTLSTIVRDLEWSRSSNDQKAVSVSALKNIHAYSNLDTVFSHLINKSLKRFFVAIYLQKTWYVILKQRFSFVKINWCILCMNREVSKTYRCQPQCSLSHLAGQTRGYMRSATLFMSTLSTGGYLDIVCIRIIEIDSWHLRGICKFCCYTF